MLTWFQRLLTPPVFEHDEDKTRQAALLHIMFLGTIALGALLSLLILPLGQGRLRLPTTVIWLPVGLGGLYLLRRGRVRLAGRLFVLLSWLILTLLAWLTGGVFSPAFTAYIMVIVMAGLLDGIRPALIFAGLSAASGVSLLWAEEAGLHPASLFQTTPEWMALGLLIIFLAVVILVHLVTHSIVRDITERREADKALRQAERRYRELFEDAPAMYVSTRDRAGQPIIADCNELFLQTLGYDRAGVIGRPLADFYTPESRRELLERGAYQHSLAGYSLATERQLVGSAGQTVDTLLRTRPETDADGRVIGTRAMYVDITERKQNDQALDRYREHLEDLVAARTAELTQANEELGRSEARYRMLYEQASDSILLFNDAGLIVECNHRFQEILGYSPAELRGRLVADFIHPDSLQEVPPQWERFRAGETVRMERPVRKKDGSYIIVEAHTRQVAANLYQSVIRDVTERKRMENALRRRNQELTLLNRANQAFNSSLELDQVLHTVLGEMRQALAITAASFWFLEPETGSLVCRQAVGLGSETVKGWTLAPGQGVAGWVAQTGQRLIVADTAAEERYYDGVDRQVKRPIRSMICLPVRLKEEIIGALSLVDTAAGRFSPADLPLLEPLVAAAAIAIENAHLHAAVQAELAERTRAEEALRQLNDQLEQRVAERTLALRQSEQVLQEQMQALRATQAQLIRSERMAALGRLMASIAHEINNPLQGVQGFLSLLEEEFNARRREEKIEFYLMIANQEIKRIASIVNRMREFYRPISYNNLRPGSFEDFYQVVPAELGVVDLQQVLDSVLQLANKKLEHSNVRVEQSWAGNLPPIQANPDYLKQVFLNLTLNAIDAMPAQGGCLRITTALDRAKLSGPRPRRVVRVEFEDTGSGIPPEVLSHLFEPMFSTKSQGTGFGLFTTYQIVTGHHGQITVTSQVGAGTTFTILLPVKQPAGVRK